MEEKQKYFSLHVLWYVFGYRYVLNSTKTEHTRFQLSYKGTGCKSDECTAYIDGLDL